MLDDLDVRMLQSVEVGASPSGDLATTKVNRLPGTLKPRRVR